MNNSFIFLIVKKYIKNIKIYFEIKLPKTSSLPNKPLIRCSTFFSIPRILDPLKY